MNMHRITPGLPNELQPYYLTGRKRSNAKYHKTRPFFLTAAPVEIGNRAEGLLDVAVGRLGRRILSGCGGGEKGRDYSDCDVDRDGDST